MGAFLLPAPVPAPLLTFLCRHSIPMGASGLPLRCGDLQSKHRSTVPSTVASTNVRSS